MKRKIFKIMKEKVTEFFVKEKGAVAILTGLLLVILIGFAALAIDASLWYSEQRKLQFAADAGAVGGAIALATTGASTINTYATNDIHLNNCTSGNNCTIVAINHPPASGPNAGNSGDVEVILSKPADMFLAGIFFGTAPTLHARAVAGNQPLNNCIVALSNTGIAVNVKGGAAILSPNCGVYSNSTASNSINVAGGGSITTNTVNSAGGTNTAGGGIITATSGLVTGAAPVTDPFGSVVMPTPSTTCTQTGYTLNNVAGSINPGTYCGGITLKSAANLTMNPGVYFLVQSGNGPSNAGNFTAASQSIITAPGVTIVMTTINGSTNYGTVSFPAQITANMSPPTTGATAGILFFGDRNSSGLNEKIDGGTAQILSGAIYFPTNNLDYSGQSGVTGNPCFQIVANTVTFTGGSTLGNGCPSTPSSGATQLIE